MYYFSKLWDYPQKTYDDIKPNKNKIILILWILVVSEKCIIGNGKK